MPQHQHKPMDQSKRIMGQQPGFNRGHPFSVLTLSTGGAPPFAEVRVCETCASLYYVELDEPMKTLNVDFNGDMNRMKEKGYEGPPQ